MTKSFSPLRYPGGKGQMYDTIVQILQDNHLENCNYIEPFAGGAGVALKLLSNGIVKSITLNDFDLSIYAFWYSILFFPFLHINFYSNYFTYKSFCII